MLLLACYLFAPQFVLLAHVINLGCCLSSHAQLLRARCACSKAKRPVPNFLAPPPHAPLRHARPPPMPRCPPPRSCISTAALLVPTRPPYALLPRRAAPRTAKKVNAESKGNCFLPWQYIDLSDYYSTNTYYVKEAQSTTNQITFTIVYVYSSVVYKLLLSRQQPLTSSSKQFCLLQKTNDHTAFVPAALTGADCCRRRRRRCRRRRRHGCCYSLATRFRTRSMARTFSTEHTNDSRLFWQRLQRVVVRARPAQHCRSVARRGAQWLEGLLKWNQVLKRLFFRIVTQYVTCACSCLTYNYR